MLEPSTQRSTPGRRAFRTVTAPSLTARKRLGHPLLTSAVSTENQNRDFVKSHLELVANRCRLLSGGVSDTLSSNSNPVMNTFSESKCLYGLRQVLKDVLESRVDPKQEVIRNKHRRELVRVWSREKVTVTETRIYSRPPSAAGSKANSQNTSFTNISNSGKSFLSSSQNLPKIVPLNVLQDDASSAYVSGSDRVRNVSDHIMTSEEDTAKLAPSSKGSRELVIPIQIDASSCASGQRSMPVRPTLTDFSCTKPLPKPQSTKVHFVNELVLLYRNPHPCLHFTRTLLIQFDVEAKGSS
ncbi:hypothetical protein Ciccas_008423 [Cichlidogyrus casuarinus]|uniref:Uncharacterized protein n=1 Tax=Cichlidogyrus casuarinus TaxID=1844966 RepID=A0ABD2Q047_9PLAT